ncbi:MAG: hypothetical protein HEQ22_16115 [Sphingopyxis sp.]|uniref:hypothetical protein n=1 Tax=Sphingopyxis sp. TaxID=1908224 RepID=UPI003D80B087
MSRAPRFVGYALMALAAVLAVLMRQGRVDAIGPFPLAAVALLVGMIGVMLVFTDLMVRGLYAQLGAAKAREAATEARQDDER